MNKKYSIVAASMTAGLIAMSGLFAAVPASAQKLVNQGAPSFDPIIAYAQAAAPRNEFFLNSSNDVEVVRFKRAHDLSICVAHAEPTTVGGARNAYPLQVSWDGNVGVINPGNCLTFDAQRVKVRPAAELPQDVVLTGTVRVLD